MSEQVEWRLIFIYLFFYYKHEFKTKMQYFRQSVASAVHSKDRKKREN